MTVDGGTLWTQKGKHRDTQCGVRRPNQATGECCGGEEAGATTSGIS